MEEARKAVRKMQDYIHEHIFDEISIGDLAKAASFSPWYARRSIIRRLSDLNGTTRIPGSSLSPGVSGAISSWCR